MRHIDRVRLDYFQKLLREHGVALEDARQRAFLFYSALMAEAFIATEQDPSARQNLADMLLKP